MGSNKRGAIVENLNMDVEKTFPNLNFRDDTNIDFRPKAIRSNSVSKTLRVAKKPKNRENIDLNEIPKFSDPSPNPRQRSDSELPPQRACKIFGAHLDELMEAQRFLFPNLSIPWFVHQCIQLLERNIKEEGLFRMSAGVEEVNQLRRRVEKGEWIDPKEDCHVVACLLKQFIREIPGTIFTSECSRELLSYAKECDRKTINLDKLKAILDKMPVNNRMLVRSMFEFMRNVANHSSKNFMTAENLARTNGPNMFPALDIVDVGFGNSVVALIIEKWPFFAGELPIEIRILRFTAMPS